MGTQTLVIVIVAILAGAFVAGGIVAYQSGKENPLPLVAFSSPFHPHEGLGDIDDEYVSLRNHGKSPVDLSGWTASNEGGTAYTFPDGSTLAAGATITVYTGCAPEGAEPLGLYWCRTKPVWDNLKGIATLRTADGKVVDVYSYQTECEKCGVR